MMMKLTYALPVIALLWNATSVHAYEPTLAENCSTIDLRPEFPLKMRNQGDISWCYAHATADYLQFHFKVPTQISAADIAIRYNLKSFPRLLRWLQGTVVPETGFAKTAMKNALEEGYCAEDAFPSETWTKVTQAPGQTPVTTQVGLLTSIKEIFQLQENIQHGFFKSAAELPYLYRFTNVSDEQFYSLVNTASKTEVLNQVRLAACAKSRTAFPGTLDQLSLALKSGSTFETIGEVLANHEPVTIDFFYGVFNNVDSYSHGLGELHTTALMGRRYDSASQQCQYLLKNSYGTDCAQYDAHHTCEAGYVWMSEIYLRKAMLTFVYDQGDLNP
jgi:hypothetical protein